MCEEIKVLLKEVIDAPVDAHGPMYWKQVLTGVKGLMDYRDILQNKDKLTEYFLEAKRVMLEGPVTPIQEDLLDELEAVLINWYPMNDFWTSTFKEFVAHRAFRDYWP